MRWLMTDLDHTCIFPKRKPSNIPGRTTVVFERASDSTRGMAIPNQLLEMMTVMSDKRVAVTAREFKDVDKLVFPFEWDYVICQHGFQIYQGQRMIFEGANDYSSGIITEVYQCLIKSFAKYEHLVEEIKLIKSGEMAAFIEVKLNNIEDADLFCEASDIRYLISEDVIFHENGRVLTLMPAGISKQHALSWLLKNYIKPLDNEPFLIGAGDSDSDMPFMRLCHMCLSPSDSQIINNISLGAENA